MRAQGKTRFVCCLVEHAKTKNAKCNSEVFPAGSHSSQMAFANSLLYAPSLSIHLIHPLHVVGIHTNQTSWSKDCRNQPKHYKRSELCQSANLSLKPYLFDIKTLPHQILNHSLSNTLGLFTFPNVVVFSAVRKT